MKVNPGQEIGQNNGQPIRTKGGGWILFPKYESKDTPHPPKELCRILKEISEKDLPNGDL